MNDQQILDELETVLEALGIHIRHEALEDSVGGLCMLNGRCCMFLDAGAHPADKARLCAVELRKQADIDTMYLKPEVRRFLEQTAPADIPAA
jgi:hypothetical protein